MKLKSLTTQNLLPLISALLILFVGCGGEVASDDTSDAGTTEDTGSTGDVEDVSCDEICTVGNSECTSTGYQTCVMVDGCPDWSTSSQCPDGEGCENGQCVASCEPQCTVGESQCADEGVQYCVDIAGCPGWSSALACSGDEVCANGRCETDCDNQCTAGERECAGDHYRVCEYDAGGCTVWSDSTVCQGVGEVCSGGECTQDCTDQCSAGEAQCSGTDGFQICEQQSSGCLDWSEPEMCTGDLECENGQCVDECSDQCTQGDAQCDGTGGVQICQEQTNGCTDWSATFMCPADHVCSGGECINECAQSCTTDVDGAVAYCDSGDCIEECAFGHHTICSDANICADLETDDSHCGACGDACAGGESCVAGECSGSCPDGQSHCAEAGGCVDLSSDENHCGSCAYSCPGAQSCTAGQCEQEPLDGCDPNGNPFGGGEGNAVDPYRICSPVQLIRIDDSEDNLGRHYALYDNIDLTGLGFSVIGQASGSPGDWTGGFTGSFNGNGFQIQSLTLDTFNTDRVALFGVLDGGTIRNVGLANVDISGREEVAALVAHNEGNIIDSWASGTVTGYERVGGLVGLNPVDGLIEGSRYSGEVKGSGRAIGGLTGFNRGRISDSESTATVEGLQYVGGLVGEAIANANCFIERSRATGDITHFDHPDLFNFAFGGLVGGFNNYGDCDIHESVATGDLTVSGTQVGGFIGRLERSEVKTRDSYATGNVEAGSRRGGFIGFVNSVLTGPSGPAPRADNSYAFGAVNGGDFAFLGVDFYDSLTASTSYWNSDRNDEDNSSQTTGLTEAEFGDQSQFLDWDFDNIWIMSDELGRPVLRWEVE